MTGYLVRVGIDSTYTYGKWNGPFDPSTGHFAYVTITEPDDDKILKELGRTYDEFLPTLKRFNVSLPAQLIGKYTHLDPDFGYLTYGDQKSRGKQLMGLKENDFIAFYSGLRSIDRNTRQLVYALIGIYHLGTLSKAKNVPREQWHMNAHTRREFDDTDIVVFADKKRSGRLLKALPFGEYRDRAYRVRKGILAQWGGITAKDGYVQRSGALPRFKDPVKFLAWWNEQDVTLIQRNNN